MKKILAIALAIMLVTMSLVACSPSKDVETDNGTDVGTENGTDVKPDTGGDGFEIALITDKGNIDDKSFNQGSWEGVVEFAEASSSK